MLAKAGGGSALAAPASDLLNTRIAGLETAFAARRGEAVQNQVRQHEITKPKRVASQDFDVLVARFQAAI